MYNSRNVTPDVQRVNQIVRRVGIPVVEITETLAPANASFQSWQIAELGSLQRALRRASGR